MTIFVKMEQMNEREREGEDVQIENLIGVFFAMVSLDGFMFRY